MTLFNHKTQRKQGFNEKYFVSLSFKYSGKKKKKKKKPPMAEHLCSVFVKCYTLAMNILHKLPILFFIF